MEGAHRVVIAEPLGGLRVIFDGLRIIAEFRLGKHNTVFHAIFSVTPRLEKTRRMPGKRFIKGHIGIRACKMQSQIITRPPAEARPSLGSTSEFHTAMGRHTFHPLAAGEALAQGQHCQRATYSRVRARPLTTRSICATVAPCAGTLHRHVSGGPQPADLHSGGSIQRVTC